MKLLTHLLIAALAVMTTARASEVTLFDYLPPRIQSLISGPMNGYELGIRYTHPANSEPVPARSVQLAAQPSTPSTTAPGEIQVRLYSSVDNNGTLLPGALLAEGANTNAYGIDSSGPVVVNFASTVVLQPGVTYFVTASVRKNTSAPMGDWQSWIITAGTLSDPQIPFEGGVGKSPAEQTWMPTDVVVFGLKLTGGSLEQLPGRGVATTAISGATFTGVYSPAVNDTGAVALRAKFSGTGITSADDTGIFVYSGSSSLVAREGDSTFGAPLASFGDPVINSESEVAFYGVFKRDDSVVTRSNDQAIFTNLGGSLALAIREGNQAPGLPSGVTFKKTRWIHLGKDGLYIGAYATSADGAVKANGIWEFANGTLTKVVAVGDTIPTVDGPQTVRSISSPSGASTGNAQSRVAASSGKLAIIVNTVERRSDVTIFE